MGRPPCCDKIGVKKGPWTPEEDIVLVSYIQDHGPGNWRSVPTNTGLLRCSKSCRLRWTNYLRPGIKRGNFTDHEEKMIIHLQALLGNRWAAIASYLPQRTDNDIKNYWNTHLKKKLRSGSEEGNHDQKPEQSSSSSQPKGQWERRLQTDIQKAKQALCEALSLDKKATHHFNLPLEPNNSKPSSGSCHPSAAFTTRPNQQGSSYYASSTENISKLLQNWMKKSPKLAESSNSGNFFINSNMGSCSEGAQSVTTTPDALDSLLSFNSDGSQCDENTNLLRTENNIRLFQDEIKPNLNAQVPFTLLEKWLFDDGAAQPGHGDLIDMSLDEGTAGLF